MMQSNQAVGNGDQYNLDEEEEGPNNQGNENPFEKALKNDLEKILNE